MLVLIVFARTADKVAVLFVVFLPPFLVAVIPGRLFYFRIHGSLTIVALRCCAML